MNRQLDRLISYSSAVTAYTAAAAAITYVNGTGFTAGTFAVSALLAAGSAVACTWIRTLKRTSATEEGDGQ